MKLNKLLSVLFLVAVFFVFAPENAFAEDFYFFRIDTELDVPAFFGSSGPTITYKCNGSGQGIVTDGTASESTNLLDGIIKIASTSVENNATHAGCNAGEAITATASFSGWVSRLKTGTVSSAGTNVTFTTIASLDYTILVNGVTDELSTALTLNGTTASATYSGTVASQSYSGGKRYIAGSTSGGTVKGGANGYVNRTSSALTISSAASQSVDFGTADDSTFDESGLSFGLKATLNTTSRSGVTESKTGATVTAGDSFGVSCTDNSDGKYYCAIPLAETGTSVKGVANGYDTNTATYTDRTAGGDAQSTVTFALAESAAGGGVAPTPTPTPTPSPTPEITATPTPTPTVTPTPTPSAGPIKLYRKVADPKVYVQGIDGMLTWIRTLEEFNAASYNWSDVQVISGPEFAQLKISPESTVSVTLFRKADDPKVYVQSSDSTLTWVRTLEEFNAASYNWSDVQVISGDEFAKLRVGGQLRVARGIGFLRVRDSASLQGKVIGQVLPDQILEFSETQNGWHQIKKDGKDFGWVFGEYIQEI